MTMSSGFKWVPPLLVFFWGSPAVAAPCARAEAACTEVIRMPGRTTGTLVYRTYALGARNGIVTRAVVVVHGAERTAATTFREMLAAALQARALDDTLVVSPRFASNDGDCADALEPDELNWRCEVPGDWRTGGSAINDEGTTSYDVLDQVLRELSRHEIFPNLHLIVVAGHSAGGELLTHYEMSNQVHEQLGIPITYVVANASLYSYLDDLRPLQNSSQATVSSAQSGAPPEETFSFAPFADAGRCSTYQRWPFGLADRRGYAARVPEELLKKQLVTRPTTYLLGGRDTRSLAGFFASCPAMAQGPTRLARGLAFGEYVREQYGAQHKTIVIPACGHNARLHVYRRGRAARSLSEPVTGRGVRPAAAFCEERKFPCVSW